MNAIIILSSFLLFNNLVPFSFEARVEDWGIRDESIKNFGFSFVESSLNTDNWNLATYTIQDVGSVNVNDSQEAAKYIDVSIDNVNGTISFRLIRSLFEFREEHWSASLELEYCLTRSSTLHDEATKGVEEVMSPTYTFMVIIKDENLENPRFLSEPENNFSIFVPWPPSLRLNEGFPIEVVDRDINLKYANLTFSCREVGDSPPNLCQHFQIHEKYKKEESDEEEDGHIYHVFLSFTENATMNQWTEWETLSNSSLSIEIVASDSAECGRSICEASAKVNLFATSSSQYHGSNNDQGGFSKGLVYGLGSVLVATSLVCVAVAYAFWRKRNQERKRVGQLTEADIREFIYGTTGFAGAIIAPHRGSDVNMPVWSQPFNRKFEIARADLKIDETTILGTGFFGVVMKGSVLHRETGNITTVAVKAVKRTHGVLHFKEFLKEIKIMGSIGKHPNIVQLIGACTTNIEQCEVYIALEHCANGNMSQLLKTHRSVFTNLVEDGKLKGYSGPPRKQSSSSSFSLSTFDLLKWACQIAKALEYLGSKGVIHGDLAARNILLDWKFVAKISDFGLSRRLLDFSNYYTKPKADKKPSYLPVRWMAIEAIRDTRFSPKSDVWSFGVLLWEMFTLGDVPYGAIGIDETFVNKLCRGMRLACPQYASIDLYNIMKDCWTEQPHDRPAPFDIKRELGSMTDFLLKTKTIHRGSMEQGYFAVLGNEVTDDATSTFYSAETEINKEANDTKWDGASLSSTYSIVSKTGSLPDYETAILQGTPKIHYEDDEC